MRVIFTYLFIGSFLFTFAQLPVSQTTQKKKILIEEFTGKTCQYCPIGHKTTTEMKEADPQNVFVLNIHAGFYAEGTPNYRTIFGNALANQSQLSGYPSVTVNRHYFGYSQQDAPAGATALGIDKIVSAATAIVLDDAYVNVAVESSLDVVTRVLTINVEAYYTGSSPAGYNLLNVAITQDEIWGPQTGAAAHYPENIDPVTNKYKHGHMLRHMVTGQWGDTISTTTLGTLVQKTYTYTLPAKIGDVDVELPNLNVIAYISQTRQEVINANGGKPVLTGLDNNLEVEAISLKLPTESCDGIVEPKIVVRNFGNNVITSLEIIRSANNGTEYTYNWTGNILPGHKENITLPLFGFAVQPSNIIDIRIAKVNGTIDEITTNNSLFATVSGVAEFNTSELNLKITLDKWASETSWRLLDSNGDVVEEVVAGTYPDTPGSTVVYKDIVLNAFDCYTFELADTWGDGGARVVIKDKATTNTIHTTPVSFSKLTTFNFATVNAAGEGNGNGDGSHVNIIEVENGIKTTDANLSFSIYPNPATSNLMISFDGEVSVIEVYNLIGKKVLTSKVTNLDVSNLDYGVYFVKLTNKEGNSISQSFVKK